MTPIDRSSVFAGVPLGLREPLLTEYEKILRNFAESRWEPAELDGGKLCEVVYTILRGHVDRAFPAKPSKPPNMINACRAFESATGFCRSVRLQIPRLLIALYEIRNGRSVGHVGGDVDPNHMDASLVVATSQWLMAELVRLFHGVSTEEASATVESMIERRIPLLWKVGGRTRVLSASMNYRDKAFALMYGATAPLTTKEIVQNIEYSNPSVFRRTIIAPAHKAALLDYDRKTDQVVLSPLGIRYVEESIVLTL